MARRPFGDDTVIVTLKFQCPRCGRAASLSVPKGTTTRICSKFCPGLMVLPLSNAERKRQKALLDIQQLQQPGGRL